MTRPTRRRVLAVGLALPAAWWSARLRAAQGLGDFTTSAGAPGCNGPRQPSGRAVTFDVVFAL